MANSVNPDQIGAVCSGSTLLASILNLPVMLGNYLQQTTSADDIFRCVFFSALYGLKGKRVSISLTHHVLMQFQQIYINTTSMISHEISNNFTSRPDLALTYYPSKYEFYWFVTRTYAYLHRFYIGEARNSSNTDPRLDKVCIEELFVLNLYIRVNIFLAMSGWRQIKCLAQGQVTVTPPGVKLELGTFQSPV